MISRRGKLGAALAAGAMACTVLFIASPAAADSTAVATASDHAGDAARLTAAGIDVGRLTPGWKVVRDAVTAPTDKQAVGSPVVIPAAAFECGLVTCSYEFTRAITRDIAGGRAGSAVCGLIPTPGSVGCRAGFGVLVGVANVARNRNACLVVHFTTTPPPLLTWWPSVDNGSRCRN
jgi:hypothetical protein